MQPQSANHSNADLPASVFHASITHPIHHMKSKLIAFLLAFAAPFGFSHSGVEIGPNGGRILELSKNETLHGEVTVKNGKFHLALLDKAMKPLPAGEQVVTVTSGDRAKPEKLEVAKAGEHYVFPLVKSGQWVIVQIRENTKGKPVTARFEYDPAECGGCKNPEWLCKCAPAKK
jgi:hypothetical protein